MFTVGSRREIAGWINRNNWEKDDLRKKDSEDGGGVCLVYCTLLVSDM